MREMKVRVWDDVLKEMLYSRVEQFDDMLGFRFDKHLETENPVYMWETGMKDKNGREIYEGDICRLGTTMYQIVWMDRYAKYGAKVIKTETVLAMGCTFPMQDYVVFSSGQCDLEIISNIYENPELLKGDENE